MRCVRRLIVLATSPPTHGLAKKILDLRVDAPQLILRPALEILHQLSRQAKKEWLTLGHGAQSWA